MELQLLIGSLLTVIGALGLVILNSMKESMIETKEIAKEAAESVKELSLEFATIASAVGYHDERIKNLEKRVK